MIYLTYNDAPSGIYSGQVIEVCRFLNSELKANVRLVSLISLRGFFGNRRKIKKEMPDAVVLPMFPGVENWSANIIWLLLIFIFFGRLRIIARGPFAASLALKMKTLKLATKVCFDARGAYEAEFREYNVAGNQKLNADIGSLEKNALLSADIRLAVSEKLVYYWADTFGYTGKGHVVIPCTVSSHFTDTTPDNSGMLAQRRAIGFTENDIVLVYSGSSAGWQSIKLADDFLVAQMRSNPHVKALFLTDTLPATLQVTKEFPDRVVRKWLEKEQVAEALRSCDYGLLIREQATTNKVSSPVKFAEYLAAGLPVIISEGIGDYPEFVRKHACGLVIGSVNGQYNLEKLTETMRNNNTSLASAYFSKKSHKDGYARILSALK